MARQAAVCAVFLAAACIAASTALAQRRGDIFVPPPRGSGDTLDASTPAASGGVTEIVKTLRGDVLNGRVLGISADGKLRLSGPQFSGEVSVALPALDSIGFPAGATENGQDEVALTNGDALRGELTSVTAESIVLGTDVAGPVKIPRGLVTGVTLGLGSTRLIESNFAQGMEPWQTRSGSWSVADGALVCTSASGNNSVVSAKLDQKEPVTFVADVKGSGGYNLQCSLALFADTNDGYLGRNSVYVMFSGSEYYLGYCQNGGSNTFTNRNLGNSIRDGVMRVAYDPQTGKMRVWLNATDLGEYQSPNKPTAGQYVLFCSQYSCQVVSLKVLRGIVPPPKSEAAAEDENDVVEFTNKDRVSVKDLSLNAGQFVIQTEFGQLTPQAGKISAILFRKKGREEPRKLKGDVQVQTVGGRLTMQFKELTPEHLVGTSSCYGDLKIQRSAIRNIRFNVYR